MPDHVRIGKVKNNQIVIRHARDNLVGHFPCAHLRLQIIGGDLGRRYDFSFLARERLLDSAIEKIGYVRIFFRLGDSQLRFASRADDLAQDVRQFRGSENERRGISHIVLRKSDEPNLRPYFAIETIKVL